MPADPFLLYAAQVERMISAVFIDHAFLLNKGKVQIYQNKLEEKMLNCKQRADNEFTYFDLLLQVTPVVSIIPELIVNR